MLDAKGKTKVLTSEAAEKSASVDPQHQITTDDAKGKGLIQEGTSSSRPPRSSIVITHRRHRETWQQREDRYRHQQEDRHRERKDADKSGIGIKIIGISRSSSTAGSRILNYQLSETALNAMAMISIIDQIDTIKTIIGVLMGRLEGGHQCTIGWGADSVCMIGLVNVSAIFLETKRNLRRW